MFVHFVGQISALRLPDLSEGTGVPGQKNNMGGRNLGSCSGPEGKGNSSKVRDLEEQVSVPQPGLSVFLTSWEHLPYSEEGVN